MRAEAAGDAGSWRQQAILGHGRWDADALRDIVQVVQLGPSRARNLGADEDAEELSATWTTGLLIRRHIADRDLTATELCRCDRGEIRLRHIRKLFKAGPQSVD